MFIEYIIIVILKNGESMENKENLLDLINLSLITLNNTITKCEREEYTDRYRMMICNLKELQGEVLSNSLKEYEDGLIISRMLSHDDSIELKEVIKKVNKLYCNICEESLKDS